MAEWLRRWTANPIRSPCVGSNPISVDTIFGYKNRTRSQFDNKRSSHIHSIRKGPDVPVRSFSASDSTSLKFVVQMAASRPAERLLTVSGPFPGSTSFQA